MKARAKGFPDFHNTEYGYSSQNNKYPNEMLKEMKHGSIPLISG
jgi:hypothetical protein